MRQSVKKERNLGSTRFTLPSRCEIISGRVFAWTEDHRREETPMKLKALGLVGIVAAMYAIPAVAHHSFAMFDAEKSVTLEGTVKEFQWTNPHAWIMLTVANPAGVAEQWAIELNGPSGLARQGWKPKTLTPGMPVSVTIHPLRDGTNGGQFMEVKLPDGTQLGRGTPPPAPAPAPAQ
jgi:hypothetical protein